MKMKLHIYEEIETMARNETDYINRKNKIMLATMQIQEYMNEQEIEKIHIANDGIIMSMVMVSLFDTYHITIR